MRREKPKSVKSVKSEITTNTMEIQGNSETTLRPYIPINLKILKKWILMTIQN
jgi:hypothetical protein